MCKRTEIELIVKKSHDSLAKVVNNLHLEEKKRMDELEVILKEIKDFLHCLANKV